MGLLRYLLAAAVVVAHSAPIAGLPLLGGGLAVKLFFLVSGFYMGLILSEKYRSLPGGLGLFYSNRFLRIFPVFWLVLAGELLLSLAWEHGSGAGDARWSLWREAWETGHGGGVVLAALSQLTLTGTEIFSLFSWTPGEGWMWHRSDLPPDSTRGWSFLLMPHSWTLSCELFFYALAPGLNRLRTPALGATLLGFLLLSAWWVGRLDPALAEVALDFFAPLQLGFFLAGLLSYRLYRLLEEGRLPPVARRLGPFLVAALFGAILSHQWLGTLSHRLSLWGLFVLAAIALPFLFGLSQRSRRDRLLGDLSYPLYLVHLMVVAAVERAARAWAPDSGFLDGSSFPLTCLALSTLLAWAIAAGFERPLDRYRQSRIPGPRPAR